jgi:hypothetical protein
MPYGDPSQYYGNQAPEELPMYGNEQASFTGMRAAYGDIPAYMMTGAGTVASGASSGLRNMFTDIGGLVRPVTYSPPARVNVGYYGQTVQQTGFLRSLTGVMGFNEVPRGTYAYDYGMRNAADFGERIGGGLAAGATTGVGLAAGATVGSVAMGAVGGFLGSALGPVGAAAGAFLGSTFGGYALGLAGADFVNDSVAQRRQLSNYLESTSFRYVGAGSPMADPRTGSGMNVQSRQRAIEMIRGMDIADPTLQTEDLSRILEQGSQMGMFAGANTMENFKKKFKDLVDGVKSVTKVFQTTLEEGMKILKDFKGIGVDPGRVPELSLMSDSIGRATGRTAQEVMGLGMQGAEIFRGTGVQMSIGYQANVMNLASVRASRDAQLLSQEAIAQAGGEEALAARMTASGLQFAQSALGRGFAATFFGPKGFNQGAFNQAVMGGNYDYNEMALQATKNIGTPQALIAYQANQEQFLSEAGAQMGGAGLQMMQNTEAMARATYMVQSGATSNMQDALRFSFQEMGLSKPEIDTRIASMRNAQGEFTARQAGAEATRVRTLAEEAQSNFLLFRAKDQVVDMAKRVVDEVAAPVSNFVDRTMIDTVDFYQRQTEGVVRADVSGIDYGSFVGLAGIDARVPARRQRALDLDVGGSFLSSSAGESVAREIATGNLESFGLRAQKLERGQEATADQLILDEGWFGAKTVVQRADVQRAVDESRNALMTVSEAQKMKDEGQLKGINSDLSASVRSGALKPTANVNEIARASFNKDFSKLSRKEYASLLLEAQAIPEMKETLDNARRGAISLQTVDEAIAVEEHAQNLAAVEQARVSANQKLGMELSPEAFNLVALAKVKRASDPRESEKLLDEALRVQSVEAKRQGVFNNQTTGDITRALGTFMKEDSFNREVGIVQASAASIARTQVRRGMEMMAGSLEVDLKTTLLSQPDQERARAAITKLQTGRPQDLLNLPDTDVKLLLETNTGRALMQQRDVVKRITDLQDNQAIKAAGSPEEQKAVFKDSMQGLKAVSEEQISKLADTFVSQGGAAAAEQAMASFATNVVGDVVTSAPSGRLRETEKGTGEEQLMLQTNINLQILQAMQALAAQLRAGR